MRNAMHYKGYTGIVAYDDETKTFYGKVADIADPLTFEGASAAELEASFHIVIDEYLDFCRELGKEPDTPFSGRFLVRIAPDIHKKAAIAAKAEGKSLNAWVAEALAKAANHVAH